MNETSFSSANCKWRPDEGYRFQLAFFREDLPIPSDKGFVSVPPLNVVPSTEPDIKNIVLSQFLQRGFLPRIKPQSEDEHFFLKLFEFPKEVSPAMSSEKVLSRFLLTKLQNGKALQEYTAEAHNVIVKCGWINLASTDFSTQPFPQLLIPKSDPQDYFDSSVAFSSLYVVPDEDAKPGLPEDALIEHSHKGVSALWEELFEIYRHHASSEIETGDASSMFVVDRRYSYAGGTVGKLSVIWLKQVEVFNNFRDLPMPFNPGQDFLSSLLLVHSTDFIANNKDAGEAPADRDELARDWRPNLGSHHVLEIASVVRL